MNLTRQRKYSNKEWRTYFGGLERKRQTGGTAARPGVEQLLPAGLRLAGDHQRLAGCWHAYAAGDDHSLKSHRNRGARKTRLLLQAYSHRRVI